MLRNVLTLYLKMALKTYSCQRLGSLYHWKFAETLWQPSLGCRPNLAPWGPEVPGKDVAQVVERCQARKWIAPAPVPWEPGQIRIDDDPHRLATDNTHYNCQSYLTKIDCGPIKYVIWRRLRNETFAAILEQLEQIFSARWAPVELLSDNEPCFRAILPLLQKWSFSQLFSCAYRASGNGIIERNHWTIKLMLAWSGGTLNDMRYWYNDSPKAKGIIPFEKLFKDSPQQLKAIGSNARDASPNPYNSGDKVCVKPGQVKCTSVWELA